MSREVIEEIVENLSESEKEDFPEILESIIEYGFLDDTTLPTLLDLEMDDVDNLLCSSEDLTDKAWKSHKAKLVKFLKKESKKYERLYYADKK